VIERAEIGNWKMEIAGQKPDCGLDLPISSFQFPLSCQWLDFIGGQPKPC
jgi:hypothetical protein